MYVITHPTTKDSATAETRKGADTAARWLRREAVAQGVSPRTRVIVTRITDRKEGN